MSGRFHVFVSYDLTDSEAVEGLAQRLRKEGIEPWLDKWHLMPGESAQSAIERCLANCDSCAVFIGRSGIGSGQHEQLRAVWDRRQRDSQFRILVVLLPGGSLYKPVPLPHFLLASPVVDLRGSAGDEQAFRRLVGAIRDKLPADALGIAPEPRTSGAPLGPPPPAAPPAPSSREKHSVYIESESEAARFKWIESEKAGHDLGEVAVREWAKTHWSGLLQSRYLEHLQGKRFWVEMNRSSFGALQRVTDPQLLSLAAGRLVDTSNLTLQQPKNEQPIEQSRTGLGSTVRDPVDCTVFAPPRAAAGAAVFVQVFTHRPDQAAVAEELAGLFDEDAQKRGFKSLAVEIARGSQLTFHLVLPGLEIDEPVQQLVWQGRPESVQFAVTVPAGHKPATVIGTVSVSQDSVPLGHIKFKLAVMPGGEASEPVPNEPAGVGARRYAKAFISYASTDRDEVIKRVQMLRHLAVEFFQDVLDLEPGARWERQLYRHIDDSDLFLLFWSSSARKSTWVLQEVRYALQRKAGNELAPPEITPVILEGPPPPPPPEELAHLHFNDYLMYFIGR